MAPGKSDDRISPESCINSANHLIELCELPFPRISSIKDINSNFFVAIFECLIGYTIPDLLLSDDTITEIHNVQAVIDSLSLDVLGLSLSHITGEDVVSGKPDAIFNLLELLEAVILQLSSSEEKKKSTKSILSTNNSNSASSKEAFRKKSAPAKPVTSSSDENTFPVLKRKLCRKTLRRTSKRDEVVPDSKTSESSSDVHSEQHHPQFLKDTLTDSPKSPLKRKREKFVSSNAKRPHTEDIEDIYNLNFQKKVRTLLLNNQSPTSHSHQLKRKYLLSLKTSIKRKTIPACKKSFLLPHNLRPKSSTQKQPIKKSSQKKNVKPDIPKKNEKLERDSDKPAFIQSVLDEFPGFHFPGNTLDLLTQCYYQHVAQMHKQLKSTLLKKPTAQIQGEKAMEDQSKLAKVLEKDIQEKNYLRETKEQKMVENKIKFGLRDARLESVKMRQYFNEFQKAMSKKLQKRNFSEEVLIEKAFKEILDIQKEKVRQLCKQVKETDMQNARQHKQYLYALKNLYQQQLAMLAESVNAEQNDSLLRSKEQKLAVQKLHQELRKRLQQDVRSLQGDVLQMIEDIHFRELDAQNFINSFRE